MQVQIFSETDKYNTFPVLRDEMFAIYNFGIIRTINIQVGDPIT